jgi:hypothetical protein
MRTNVEHQQKRKRKKVIVLDQRVKSKSKIR